MTEEKLPKTFLKDVLLEILVNAIISITYFFLLLQFLNQPLTNLFHNDITMYGIVCVLFTITQGFVLDSVTGFMMNILGLHRIK